jgi:hypothetical protein
MGLLTIDFFFVESYSLVIYGAPSLMRGRVCHVSVLSLKSTVRRSVRVPVFKIGSTVLQGGKNCMVLRVVPIYSAPPQSLSFLNWPPTF